MDNKLLSELCKEWIEVKKISVKYSSFVKYENVIDRYIIPYFKKYTIQQVNIEVVIEYFNHLFSLEKYANSTLSAIKYVMKSVFQFTYLKYGITTCNFDLIKINKKSVSIVTLTEEQKSSLSNYCFVHYDAISLAILTALYGGLRIGEICALKWSDINIYNQYIDVNKSVQRIKSKTPEISKTTLMISSPKTDTSIRIVPIPKFIVEYIETYKKVNIANDDHFVITNTSKIPDPRTIQNQFSKLCKVYDFSINFHSLRHCYATSCVIQEIDIKSLSEILGHSNVTTTLNLYVHSSLEHKKLQVSKISRA